MSDRRVNMMYATAESIAIAFNTGKSEALRASRIIEPSPGILKKLSSSNDPRIKNGRFTTV